MYDVMLSSQLALILSICKVNVNRTDVAYAYCTRCCLCLVQLSTPVCSVQYRYDVIAIVLLCIIVIGHLLFCCIT